MTPSRHDPAGAVESIGALLARVRLAAGKSQLRVAELLCAAAGVPTITRHEISRWERELRVPSGYWLRWLAAVLDVPLDELERAAAATRARRDATPDDATPDDATPDDPWPATRPDLDLRGRIDVLRRTDDLVGGADLTRIVDGELDTALALLRSARREHRRRALLPLVAELAQLAGWVAADAGRSAAADRAHRIGLRAAREAGDEPLVGHLLGTLAHLTGRRDLAPRLAQEGYARARPSASATTRCLLLHRVAFAAARTGDGGACERALAAADRLYDRRDPANDPGWLYWLDDAELAAMTGRCYAALGRPRIAAPLLAASLGGGQIRPRPWALYAAWLAAAHLDAGDVEAGCATAGRAVLAAVRVGSVRAAREVAGLHPRLRAVRRLPAVAGYARLLREAAPYLPTAAPYLPTAAPYRPSATVRPGLVGRREPA